ncbi:hypothetical protein ACFY1J_20990 [Streptomyces sp. NPDC001406]|uniref:hypothetical protein n=1 Tax=Streptomyces sp. NPDC001406 TaxID=3364572 RepID=UPI0036AB7A93
MLEFATVDGARACVLAARTGTTPGMDADLILLRADDLTVFPANNPAGTIVAAGHPGLVDTVLVAGRVVKRDRGESRSNRTRGGWTVRMAISPSGFSSARLFLSTPGVGARPP